ncbi:MAG TPA: sulfite exporter TauE/SafE family protein [Gammaproteobacteria bacterium]|nr:sulfite exporter TauE/SafE family protein [Gammaproteobacteria bacterium]
MVFETASITLPIWLPLLWGVLVGLVFSTVGAAGGILASVGLISVMGVQDPNLVKAMAQALTLATPLIAVSGYYRQCRVVVSLAVILGAGSILGALIGSTLSVSYLADLKIFRPVFGVLVLVIALQIIWQLLSQNRQTGTHAGRAAAAFEGLVHDGGSPCAIGVRHLQYSVRRILFEFGGEQFSYPPWLPFLAGTGIATVSSALGVGGGFLLVPFMTILLGLPMFIVAGTAALAIAVSSMTSIANYMRLGIELDIPLLLLLLAGTLAGAWTGPRLSRHLHERWLQGILCLVLLLIGLRYLGVF